MRSGPVVHPAAAAGSSHPAEQLSAHFMNHTSRGSMKCLVSGGPSCLLMHPTPSVEHGSFKSGRGGFEILPPQRGEVWKQEVQASSCPQNGLVWIVFCFFGSISLSIKHTNLDEDFMMCLGGWGQFLSRRPRMDQDIFTADPRLRPQRAPADRSHCCHPVSYRKEI